MVVQRFLKSWDRKAMFSSWSVVGVSLVPTAVCLTSHLLLPAILQHLKTKKIKNRVCLDF